MIRLVHQMSGFACLTEMNAIQASDIGMRSRVALDNERHDLFAPVLTLCVIGVMFGWNTASQ